MNPGAVDAIKRWLGPMPLVGVVGLAGLVLLCWLRPPPSTAAVSPVPVHAPVPVHTPPQPSTPTPAQQAFYQQMAQISGRLAEGQSPSADELNRWLAEQWRLVELRLLTPEQAMQDVRFLQQVLPDQHAPLMAHQARLGH